MIVMMAGLPGSGKSTISRAIAHRLGAAVLDKDIIRAALFDPQHVEYSAAQDDFCQEVMLQAADYLLTRNPSMNILLDGRTFSRRYQRERVFSFFRERNTKVAVLECFCSEDSAIKRLEQAEATRSHLATNRTAELYRHVRADWEPIDGPKLVIDTDAEIHSCVEQALRYLTSGVS